MNQPSRLVLSLTFLFVSAACAAPRVQPPATSAPPAGPPATAAATLKGAPEIAMIRSPTCGCCAGHAEHLAAAGYAVSSTLTDGYVGVKDAHRIPPDMRSCHTSLVGLYFVEGHVPVAAIDRLLAERPAIDGIALPGMPPGSPGMGGVANGLLTVYAIADGQVVGEFGSFAAVD